MERRVGLGRLGAGVGLGPGGRRGARARGGLAAGPFGPAGRPALSFLFFFFF